ncbi:MAG: tRNA 2-selenouridine(34) synthase MnmH [Candidatus Cloacimonetes bacterium]|nr:tRNA 2-selenouridine(34) synthase MnmH [Candidatus Cloacimonadota bacterium]MCF7814910.1 tRNA 2-selenouridine(34) synthase MnmH [Candidatus Cloacimonadota bacterium]MCF7868092.1 tRNA 2-selenouridine(34) synthase MnmH [Candidatus Cloacimonadota bacterium]MCF7883558.1 tRNA 2-selenouridine(34) synthase MnmH [Candidatus Cloacimonadota bacterium]
MQKIPIETFLQKASSLPIIDVRTSDEFTKGHIPGACNIPLFSNDERAIVGTKYKQENRESAFREGIHLIAAKIDFYLSELEKLHLSSREILLHCWRGGMRSEGMANLFRSIGYKVHLLEGGYKSFRRTVLKSFEKSYNFIIIGGMTGSGKSDVLREISKKDEQIIDLEGIANHKGSAFGALGQPAQPTVEQFENELFGELNKLDPAERIWLEDESQLIGKVRIPKPFFLQMRNADVYKLELSKELRIKRLMQEYTNFNKDKIIFSIHNIAKRLGGLAFQKAVESVQKNDFHTAIDIVLSYYDKTYSYGISKRKDQTIIPVKIEEDNPPKTAKILLQKINSRIPRKIFIFQ